ncbi:DNA ligase D [Alcaligenaceae bacterium]|nr:DNA ligase D [Alcaligenaceae bacterium]
MPRADPLKQYKAKRNFSATPEPRAGGSANQHTPTFVVQKHWASRLHYDFRLELNGTMKSWAVPKGPSLDPAVKRMAIQVEDHPISYNQFEGLIPKGEYGAGKVIIWDRGTWEPDQNPQKGYRDGKLTFVLRGEKLRGKWALVRMKGSSEKQPPWLLMKEKDDYARAGADVDIVAELAESVAAPRGKQAALPPSLKPQLATLTDTPPADTQGWIYEVKLDGYRLLARIEGSTVKLLTRNGHDWTARLPQLERGIRAMQLPSGWYDGEIVVMNEQGLPDFQALQNAFDSDRTDRILYYLFDLPYCDGRDLRNVPLHQRRTQLESLLSQAPSVANSPLRFSTAFDVPANEIHATACKLGLEGVIGKRKASLYVSRRSTDWLKLKCQQRQEFVIVGYTEPKGSRSGLGSLLLATHDESGALRYAGNVGTGFDSASLARIRTQLDALTTKTSPLTPRVATRGKVHWVKPVLLAEVSFAQWTQSGRIRHAVFQGLRTDKPARKIIRETSMTAQKKSSMAGKIKVTHPERIIDKESGTSKVDVVHYYAEMAALMMPHLKHRPVSLVRAPEGVKGEIFFQKHMETTNMAGVRTLSQDLDPGHAPLISVFNKQGLPAAAQMNVLEFHTWNARHTLMGKPDRMVFDLDPGKGVSWRTTQEAALLLQAFLLELSLQPFCKTSGGKGLHVVVPIQRRHDWDTVKGVSKAVVQHLAKTMPDRFASKSGPRNRVGKIFIDYLRNGWGATTVVAWSLRARPGMGVSVPVYWEEVEKLESAAQWHIGNIDERLSEGNQPWADYASRRNTLTRAMKALGYKAQR